MCIVAAAFREAEVTIGARTVLGTVPVSSRPWEGVTGVSLFSVSCFEMGTSVSVPPKPPHLERAACRPGQPLPRGACLSVWCRGHCL